MRDAEEERIVVGQKWGIATMTGERSIKGRSKKNKDCIQAYGTQRQGRTRQG